MNIQFGHGGVDPFKMFEEAFGSDLFGEGGFGGFPSGGFGGGFSQSTKTFIRNGKKITVSTTR